MLVKTLFAGFGGQGVLMMGYMLAYTAMNEDYHVTYMPSYGAEVRGGTANCTINISDEEIASPIASSPDNLVVMNEPSMDRFENSLKSGGLLLVNSTLVKKKPRRDDVSVFTLPAAAIAEELGSPRSANMVIVGALARLTGLVGLDALKVSVGDIIGAKRKQLVEVNYKAVETGFNFFDAKPVKPTKKSKEGKPVEKIALG